MKRIVWTFVAASLVAAATQASEPTPVRGYVLDGEVMLYPRGVTALPETLSIAPRGATRAGDHVLSIRARADVGFEGRELATFSSGPLFTGEAPIEAANAGQPTLELGDVVLTNVGVDGWTFVSASGELAARPLFRLDEDRVAIHELSADRFAVSGELFLHPAFAAELGLSPDASWLVGAITMTAGSYPGLAPAAPYSAPAIAPAGGTGGTASLGTGPDVIVSTIGATLTKNGTVGTISAYSMTTVSCNIGTSLAEWFANSPDHPVIGQQFYRLKTVAGSTRFEQVGQSWLKHGFCAADVCSCPGGTCAPNGSCDWLGLFATDTYSAGLNGNQQDLGPRSEIQPWTGAYPYPYVLAWNQTGNAIYKRTQVENADLNPALNAGALYWGESAYICTDEPTYHRYNNYSYRRVTNGGADGTALGFTGGTITQQPAINAWAANDTGVTLTNIDVPSDGRLILGSKVTDLSGIGNGPWHYEYALFNMNSHNGVNEFRVPLPASATVANAGFHDIFYHSGEPFSGTDWANATTASEINWTTSEFATSANANALRWSTTYNFRFDANGPPTTGTITLGLFRNNGSITVSAPVPDVGTGAAIAPFCFGDGSGTACPCGNNSPVGAQEGCLNSLGSGGKLTATGTPSLTADTVTLLGSGMPDSSALYFQGTTQQSGGAGAVFGDGLRCAGGSVTRLGTKMNFLGSSQYPDVGDSSVSVRGGIVAPGDFTYQVWYRNAASFCSADTFNLTNGVAITWAP